VLAKLTLESQIADLEALVRTLLSRDHRSIADQRVVNTRIWHQVGLELVQVDVERTIETQGRRDRADNLSNETVEVLVVGTGDVQATAADIIHGLVVDKEGAVGVLNGAVGGKHSVVGFDDRGRDARRRVYGEFKLALLAVVGGKTLEEQGTESRSSSTAERVEDEEALEGGAVVSQMLARFSVKEYSKCLPATRRIRSITLSTISLPMV
jgi:hypothetical protein